VEHYALALIPNRFSGDEKQPGQKALSDDFAASRISMDWNPGSPISARTLVLAAENRLGRIDEAILVCDPPSVSCAAADLDFSDIEVLANDHIKNWFFLVKELASVFKAREKGTLAFVYPEKDSRDDDNDLLGSAALASFRSFTRSLLAAASAEPYLTLGFSGADTSDSAGFASFVFKQLDEGNRRASGKLHKHGKLGFFR